MMVRRRGHARHPLPAERVRYDAHVPSRFMPALPASRNRHIPGAIGQATHMPALPVSVDAQAPHALVRGRVPELIEGRLAPRGSLRS